jgi:acyl-CoA thioester hydrolase
MIFENFFVTPVRVEFEDVDMYGVLHHPKFLAYVERGRSQMLEQLGLTVAQLAAEYHGIVLADLEAKYFRPGKIGDRVFVVTRIGAIKAASIRFVQVVTRFEHTVEELKEASFSDFTGLKDKLFWAELRFAAVDLREHRPIKIPEIVKKAFHLPDEDSQIPKQFTDIRLYSQRK